MHCQKNLITFVSISIRSQSLSQIPVAFFLAALIIGSTIPSYGAPPAIFEDLRRASIENSLDSTSFQYHPDLHLQLGAGLYSAFPLISVPERCFESSEERSVDLQGNGVVEARFEMEEIDSRNALHQKLNYSVNISAHLRFLSGLKTSIESDLSREYEFGNDSLLIMVRAQSDFGRFELKQLKLQQEYKDLLLNGKDEEFIKRCGTDYVAALRRGNLVVALISIRNIRNITKEQLGAKFGLSGNIGIVQPEVGFNVKDFSETLSRYGTVTVNFFAIGGNGLQSLGSLLAGTSSELNSLATIKMAMESYMKTMAREAAPPMRYYIKRFPGLTVPNEFRSIDGELVSLYNELTDTEATMHRIKMILKHQTYHPPEVVNYYQEQLRALQLRLYILWGRGRDLVENRGLGTEATKKVDIPPKPEIEWKEVKVNSIKSTALIECHPGNNGCGYSASLFFKPDWKISLDASIQVNIPSYVKAVSARLHLVDRTSEQYLRLATKPHIGVQAPGVYDFCLIDEITAYQNFDVFQKLQSGAKVEIVFELLLANGERQELMLEEIRKVAIP